MAALLAPEIELLSAAYQSLTQNEFITLSLQLSFFHFRCPKNGSWGKKLLRKYRVGQGR